MTTSRLSALLDLDDDELPELANWVNLSPTRSSPGDQLHQGAILAGKGRTVLYKYDTNVAPEYQVLN